MSDPVAIAWAAGLFEGEGSITTKRNDARSQRLTVRFTLASTDLDVVEKFWHIMECGNIYGPSWRELSTKPLWTWSCSRRSEVERIARLFGPHLGVRRMAKLQECLDAFASQPPKDHHNLRKTHCPKGHAYEGDNILWDEGRRRCRTCERARWTAKNRLFQAKARLVREGLSPEDAAAKIKEMAV